MNHYEHVAVAGSKQKNNAWLHFPFEFCVELYTHLYNNQGGKDQGMKDPATFPIPTKNQRKKKRSRTSTELDDDGGDTD
jgi:hypothetical protein